MTVDAAAMRVRRFLDCWDRHMTVVEDPGLIRRAAAGSRQDGWVDLTTADVRSLLDAVAPMDPIHPPVEVKWCDLRHPDDPGASCRVLAEVDLEEGDIVDITSTVHTSTLTRPPGHPENFRRVLVGAPAGQPVRVGWIYDRRRFL